MRSSSVEYHHAFSHRDNSLRNGTLRSGLPPPLHNYTKQKNNSDEDEVDIEFSSVEEDECSSLGVQTTKLCEISTKY